MTTGHPVLRLFHFVCSRVLPNRNDQGRGRAATPVLRSSAATEGGSKCGHCATNCPGRRFARYLTFDFALRPETQDRGAHDPEHVEGSLATEERWTQMNKRADAACLPQAGLEIDRVSRDPHRGEKAAEQSRFALLALIRIEEWGQHVEGYVTRCLAENRAAGTCIELGVVRYRQGFPITARRGTLEFHVTSPLRNDFKSKSAQYPCDFSTGEPLKPGQGKSPTQRLR